MNILIEALNKGSVEIKVKPNSSKNKLVIEGDSILVYIKEKPENNKANFEIEKFLTRICKRQVKIILGKTSKKKVVKFY